MQSKFKCKFFFFQHGIGDCPPYDQLHATPLLAIFWRSTSPKNGSPWRLPDFHDRVDVEGDQLIHKLTFYLHLQIQKLFMAGVILYSRFSKTNKQRKTQSRQSQYSYLIFFLSISIMTSNKIATFRRHCKVLGTSHVISVLLATEWQGAVLR